MHHQRRQPILFSALFLSFLCTTYWCSTGWIATSPFPPLPPLSSSLPPLLKTWGTIFLLYLWTTRQFYSCLLMGADKVRAMRHEFRISEKELLQGCCVSFTNFGWVGVVLGMLLFAHKVQKTSFLVRVVEISVANFVLVFAALFALSMGHALIK